MTTFAAKSKLTRKIENPVNQVDSMSRNRETTALPLPFGLPRM
jgi:hypothetical protein